MKSCGGIFVKQRQTAAGLCDLCGLPDATHMAVVLTRWERPALFREGEPIGSARITFRGRLILDLCLWRDVRGPRLELSFRTSHGPQLGALEDVSRFADAACRLGGDAGFWRAWVDERFSTFERQARERFGQPLTLQDVDREDVTLALLAAVPIFQREAEVHAGERVGPAGVKP